MKEILTITRKDIQLLLLDKASVILTFALPVVLIGLIGNVMSSTFPNVGISSYDYAFSKFMFWGYIKVSNFVNTVSEVCRFRNVRL